MNNFELLKKEVQQGLDGRNQGIPMGFNRLNRYIGIRKRIYTLLGGLSGSGKCLAKGTLVLMSNGSYKKVEDIKKGEFVKSINSNSKVLGVTKGKEEMYEIQQSKGINYTVNASHILSLKPSGKNLKKIYGETLNISVKEYLKLPQWHKNRLYGYKTGVDFEETHTAIPPYLLGLWLGDGTKHQPQITNEDEEVIKYLKNYCDNNNYKLSQHKNRYSIVSPAIPVIMYNDEKIPIKTFSSITEASLFVNRDVTNISEAIKKEIRCGKFYWKKQLKNHIKFKELLKRINVLDDKHIPFNFSRNSKKKRLELLAGLIDSDGYYSNNSGYEIVQKNKNLAKDIVWLSQSLGFYTSIKEKKATLKSKNYSCKVYRINIYGNIHEIPVKIKRKKAKVNTPNKDNLRTKINIVSKGVGDYYGFELQGSKLFFLEDFTVTHNTTFIDDAYVLNPIDWYLQNKDTAQYRIHIWYRSMERSRVYKLGKWMSRKIFLSEGIEIPVSKLMGWVGKMTKDEHDLFLKYEDYIHEVSELVTFHDGPENAVGIAKDLKKFALKRGKIEQLDQYNKIYIPDDDNEIVIPVIDHIGLTKTTAVQVNKKQAIDKLSNELQYARDFYGYSPVAVSQFNRSISNPIRIKTGDVEPNADDFKESGGPSEDADVILALFDPMRYNVEDPSGYNIEKLRDQYGAKYFRSLRLIKNSYGEDDIRIGLGFYGAVGIFKELPKVQHMTNDDYTNVITKQFFLE